MPAGNGGSERALAERGQRWSDLRLRAISALVLVPFVLICLWHGGAPFIVLIAAAGALLAGEWARLSGWQLVSTPAMLLIAAVVAAVALAAEGLLWQAGVALGLGALALIVAQRPGTRMRMLVGLAYIGAGAAALAWLRHDPIAGHANLLFLLLLVWASDIGAYAVGRLVGGPKLAPRLSPNKTWAGAVGGLVIAVAVGVVASFALQPPVSWPRAAVLAAGLGIIAQAGDLFESAFKRHMGAKDSGHLIPGHGGLLDRLDALLAAAPVAALLALATGRGVVLWQ